ncbi:MAG: hypothetical protein AAFX01_03790 [Cyanobacteria bacterium J06638_28]
MTHALAIQDVSSTRLIALFLQLTQRPTRFLVFALGLALGTLTALSAVATPVTAQTTDLASLNDGTHVFGEAAEAGQLGSTYMVMNVQAGKIVGAFYQPSSSFDCFHGELQGNAIALTVINSYDQTTHPFTVALQTTNQVASQTGAANNLVPEGFHTLPEVSTLDADILATCQAL